MTTAPTDSVKKPRALGPVTGALLCLLLAVGFLTLDVAMPLGVAGGVPYVAVVLAGVWLPWRSACLWLALLGTLLTMLGYLLSEPGGVPWMVFVNRALALYAIWVTGLLGWRLKVNQLALVGLNEELETRVAERTAALQQSENRFRDFAEASSDWLWELDSEFRHTALIGRPEGLAGRSNADMIGRTRWEILDVDRQHDEFWPYLSEHRPFRDVEFEATGADGQLSFRSSSGVPVFDEGGRFAGYRGATRNITDRKLAEFELMRQRELLMRAEELAQLGSWSRDPETAEVYWSEGMYRILGLDPKSDRPSLERLRELIHPDDRSCEAKAREKAYDGKPYDIRYRIVRPDGEIRHVNARREVIRGEDGEVRLILGTSRDVTDEVHAQERIESAQRTLRDAIESLNDAFALFDADDRLVLFNSKFREFYDLSAEAIEIGNTFEDILRYGMTHGQYPEVADDAEAWAQARLAWHSNPGEPRIANIGGNRWVRSQERRTSEGGTVGIRTDVSELIEREQALRESEKRFRDFAEASSDWFWETDADLRLTWLSDTAPERTGIPNASLVGRTVQEVGRRDLSPELWDKQIELMRQREAFRNFEFPVSRAGEKKARWIRLSGQPIYNAPGGFVGYRGTASDVTVEVEAHRAAQTSAERLAAAIASMSGPMALFDAEDRLVTCNDAYRQLLEPISDLIKPYPAFEEILRANERLGLTPTRQPGGDTDVETRMARHREGGSPFEIANPDGRQFLVTDQRLPDGGWIIALYDITEAKRLEAELRQAQRLDAMGTLVGGLAHEMNNMLQPIMGLSRIALSQGIADETVRQVLQGIEESSRHANDLLQTMLGFGRRDLGQAEAVALDEAMALALRLVRRSLPEGIELEVEVGNEPGSARISPIEFAQVVLNLGKNASDAMDGEGRVRISLQRNVSDAAEDAGAHAVLSVSDNGPGVPAEVRRQIFEPFFTTKQIGRGTGLGLSMVYNIVRDWGGEVRLAEASEGGARFEVTVPLA